MSKVAVVFWSGTGNTEAMANKVADGAKAAGAEVQVLTPETFDAAKMDEFDAVAVPTAGATASGCVSGRRPARTTGLYWPARA